MPCGKLRRMKLINEIARSDLDRGRVVERTEVMAVSPHPAENYIYRDRSH
jgi:hypothetical protein